MAGFRLLLVAVHIDGHDRLIFGEAVGAPNPGAPASPMERFTVPVAGSSGLPISILHAVIEEAELVSLQDQLLHGSITQLGMTISVGPLTRRPPLIVPVTYQGENSSVHPDGRFTYLLQEWWDHDEALMRELWDTRSFGHVASLIAAQTGLDLADNSDRIGNFLRFDRLSSWRIDRQTSLESEGCWVRALHDGPRPSVDLVLNARFLAGNEVVAEQTGPLPLGGVAIGLGHGYSAVSLGLYDAKTGHLLARESGEVQGLGPMRMGHLVRDKVTDNDGQTHQVSWPEWHGPPPDQIDECAPWGERSRLRALRTRRLREHWGVRVFKKGERTAAVDMIREIIRQSGDSGFLYLWDPYFDSVVANDFLGWLPPGSACQILCGNGKGLSLGSPIPLDPQRKLADIAAALDVLRRPPKSRQIACRFRAKRGPNGYAPIYHDRFIITRNAAWVLGASLNGIGNKEGSIVEILDPDPLRWLFEDEWASPEAGWVEVRL